MEGESVGEQVPGDKCNVQGKGDAGEVSPM